jgi:hypothetical protein
VFVGKICTFYQYLVWCLRVSEQEAESICYKLQLKSCGCNLGELSQVFETDINKVKTGPFAGFRMFQKEVEYIDLMRMLDFDSYNDYLDSMLPRCYSLIRVMKNIIDTHYRVVLKIDYFKSFVEVDSGDMMTTAELDELADLFMDDDEKAKSKKVVPVPSKDLLVVNNIYEEEDCVLKGYSVKNQSEVFVTHNEFLKTVQMNEVTPINVVEVEYAKSKLEDPEVGVPLFVTKFDIDGVVDDRCCMTPPCDDLGIKGFDYQYLLREDEKVMKYSGEIIVDDVIDWSISQSYRSFLNDIKDNQFIEGQKILFHTSWMDKLENWKIVGRFLKHCSMNYVGGSVNKWDWVLIYHNEPQEEYRNERFILVVVPKLYKLMIVSRSSYKDVDVCKPDKMFRDILIRYDMDELFVMLWKVMEGIFNTDGSFECVKKTKLLDDEDNDELDPFIFSEIEELERLYDGTSDNNCVIPKEDYFFRPIIEYSEETLEAARERRLAFGGGSYKLKGSGQIKFEKHTNNDNNGDFNFKGFGNSKKLDRHKIDDFDENKRLLKEYTKDMVKDYRLYIDLDNCLKLRRIKWNYLFFMSFFSNFFDSNQISKIEFNAVSYVRFYDGGLEYNNSGGSNPVFLSGRISVLGRSSDIMFYKNKEYLLLFDYTYYRSTYQTFAPRVDYGEGGKFVYQLGPRKPLPLFVRDVGMISGVYKRPNNDVDSLQHMINIDQTTELGESISSTVLAKTGEFDVD